MPRPALQGAPQKGVVRQRLSGRWRQWPEQCSKENDVQTIGWQQVGANPFHLALPYSTSPGTTLPRLSPSKPQVKQADARTAVDAAVNPGEGGYKCKRHWPVTANEAVAAGLRADFG